MLSRQRLHRLFSCVEGGSYNVIYRDGTAERCGGGEPRFTLLFRDPGLLDLPGDDIIMVFGEACMDGRIGVEGGLLTLGGWSERIERHAAVVRQQLGEKFERVGRPPAATAGSPRRPARRAEATATH